MNCVNSTDTEYYSCNGECVHVSSPCDGQCSPNTQLCGNECIDMNSTSHMITCGDMCQSVSLPCEMECQPGYIIKVQIVNNIQNYFKNVIKTFIFYKKGIFCAMESV